LHLKTQVLINVEGRLVILGDSSAAPQNDVEFFMDSTLGSEFLVIQSEARNPSS